MKLDPRAYQVFSLTALLAYGIGFLDFEVLWQNALVILLAAQLTQWCCTKLWRLPSFDPRSALISSLSLCLLLRTGSLWIAALAAALTISSKFIFRARDKHIFNPTALALVVAMLLSERAWISAGQWGSFAIFAFAIACVGGLVVNRSERSDITYAFVAFYALILVARSLWLAEPMTIPLHRLQNGAFLLFSFFMISDPKTSPDSRAGRILFAFLVALGAGVVHFLFFRNNGMLWSLVALAPMVPVIDWLLPGKKYLWPGQRELTQSPAETALAPALIHNPSMLRRSS